MFGVHLEGALIDLSGSVLVRREAAPAYLRSPSGPPRLGWGKR